MFVKDVISLTAHRMKTTSFKSILSSLMVWGYYHNSCTSWGRTGAEFWDAVKRDTRRPDFDFAPIFNFAFDNRRNNFFKISIVPGRARLQEFEADTRSVMSQEDLTAPLHEELRSSVAPHHHNSHPGDASALLHSSSQILVRHTAERLHSYLLPAAQIEGFSLVFSTYNDGWNLETLYNKVFGVCVVVSQLNVVQCGVFCVNLYSKSILLCDIERFVE